MKQISKFRFRTRTTVRIFLFTLLLEVWNTKVAFPQIVEPLSKIPADPNFWNRPEPKMIFIRKEYIKENAQSVFPIYSLWAAMHDGSDPRFISYCRVGSALLSIVMPTLSPDAKKIVFTGLDENSASKLRMPSENGLWVYDLETNRKQRVFPEPVSKVFWSKDSRSLFFEKGVQGLFKIHVETKEVVKILSLGEMEAYENLSGENFLLGSTITLHDLLDDKLLYTRLAYKKIVKSIETRGQQKITKIIAEPDKKHIWILETTRRLPIWLTEGDEPRFSPDGRYVLFRRKGEIWQMDIYGKNEKRIGIGNDLAFSPDGEKIAYVDAGTYQNPHGWINVYVADLHDGSTTPILLIPGWKEIMARSIPNFERSFNTIGYFNEKPKLVWLSNDKIIYSVGYATFFLADLNTHTAQPLFQWIQVSPRPEYFDSHDSTLVLTSPMIKTSRRENHPLYGSGWLEEEDIWKVSVDWKRKKMIVENGFMPQPVKSP